MGGIPEKWNCIPEKLVDIKERWDNNQGGGNVLVSEKGRSYGFTYLRKVGGCPRKVEGLPIRKRWKGVRGIWVREYGVRGDGTCEGGREYGKDEKGYRKGGTESGESALISRKGRSVSDKDSSVYWVRWDNILDKVGMYTG